MKILNLSPDFQMPPQVEAISFDSFIFNGGEPHLKLGKLPQDKEEEILIAHRVTNSDAFLQLLLATDALRRAGFRKISAWLPYFPAARQDRIMVPGEPLSVKVYTQIINAQGYERLLVFDPHSDVTPALLDRVEVMTNLHFVQKALQLLDSQSLYLIAPDAGATKKAHKLAQELGGMEVVACEKIRDPKTGVLSGFSVFSDDLKGRNCLIIDDICDGGGTFLGIADALRKKGAGRVYLAVSHGIFSQGFEKLAAALDGIFTTDSFKNIAHPSVRQLMLADVFDFIF